MGKFDVDEEELARAMDELDQYNIPRAPVKQKYRRKTIRRHDFTRLSRIEDEITNYQLRLIKIGIEKKEHKQQIDKLITEEAVTRNRINSLELHKRRLRLGGTFRTKHKR